MITFNTQSSKMSQMIKRFIIFQNLCDIFVNNDLIFQSLVEGYYCAQKKVIFLYCVSVYDTNQLNSLFGEMEENLSEKVNIVILNLVCLNSNF